MMNAKELELKLSDALQREDVLKQQLAESQREFRAADATIENLQMQVEKLAAENAGLINSSACILQDGRPPHGFYASEWFIAKLKNGEYAALKALPEEYSHDYRTNDGTYYTKDWIVGWMQTPDTEYRPNVKTPATDAFLAEVRAQGVDMYAERKNNEMMSLHPDTHAVGSIAAAMSAEVKELREFAAQLRQGGAA